MIAAGFWAGVGFGPRAGSIRTVTGVRTLRGCVVGPIRTVTGVRKNGGKGHRPSLAYPRGCKVGAHTLESMVSGSITIKAHFICALIDSINYQSSLFSVTISFNWCSFALSITLKNNLVNTWLRFNVNSRSCFPGCPYVIPNT